MRIKTVAFALGTALTASHPHGFMALKASQKDERKV
jgi:ABC-type uncharacterized transport system substrate-binding protein